MVKRETQSMMDKIDRLAKNFAGENGAFFLMMVNGEGNVAMSINGKEKVLSTLVGHGLASVALRAGSQTLISEAAVVGKKVYADRLMKEKSGKGDDESTEAEK